MSKLTNERVSIEALRQVLTYDADTGILTWTQRVANNVFAGMEAGSVDGQGYKHFAYKRCIYPCHQVAWALVNGEWAELGIDHKDGDRSNNRIANLREATTQQNHANRRRSGTNRSGIKGVRFKAGKWEVAIGFIADPAATGRARYGLKYLGRYDTADAASAAYKAAAVGMHGEFYRGG